MNKKILMAGLLSLLSTQFSFAETSLSYPELEVTPRATERLAMQVEKEKEVNFFAQLPMQLSATTTLLTGLLQIGHTDEIKDPNKRSPNAGIIVGAAWLGINYYVNQKYHIYEKAVSDVNKIPGKTTHDQLIKERIAEEGINQAAHLAIRMKWLSVVTNFGANAYMISKVKKETTAEYMGVFSALVSLAPIIFTSEWEDVAANQNSYKKKVYGPIFTTSVFETSQGKFTPGFLLTSSF